jgi:hypothetical protein
MVTMMAGRQWLSRRLSQGILPYHRCRRLFSSQVNGYAQKNKSDPAPTTSASTSTSTTANDGRDGKWIQGQVLDLAADPRTFRPGDKLDIPYELTISESMQDFWQSVRIIIELYCSWRSNFASHSTTLHRLFICKIGFIRPVPFVVKWDYKIGCCPFPWPCS